MTHHRPAGSIEHALLDAIRALSDEEIESATGKRRATFYKAANPSTGAGLHLADAIALDKCLMGRGRPAVFLNIYLDTIKGRSGAHAIDIERKLLEATMGLGELARRISTAMEDNILEDSERRWIAEQAHDLRDVIDTILQHVEPPHEPDDVTLMREWQKQREGEGAA